VFVLGLDQGVIARGIEIKYREFGQALGADGETQKRLVIDGARYLEKIIQLPFQIPPIERSDLADFVTKLVAEWPHPDCPMVFAEGLGENPRQVKRTVNVFLLLWKLAEKRATKLQGQIKPIRLAKIVAIQHVYPELYEVLKETPRLLRELEDYYRTDALQPQREEGSTARQLREDFSFSTSGGSEIEPPPALASYVSRAAVRRILTLHSVDILNANFTGLTLNELKMYFTLTRSAEAPLIIEADWRVVFDPQMVHVPAGPFLMGSTDEQVAQAIKDGLDKQWADSERPQHIVELSEYFIGKYPVTNAEYQAFIREAEYNPPRHWDSNKYPEEKGDHPVVNVSWKDAVSYCEWLSKKTGKTYRLPTEAEREKAARGAEGWIYPWGNEWDPNKLNSAEGGAGDTTPAGQYSPVGDSPYGCADMAGNVWEWCGSLFKPYPYRSDDGREDLKAKGLWVFRGGAFRGNRGTRCACRNGARPDYHIRDLGFRVARSA
jgi:formylglycine-generating enzyme required for sulfatase activity